MIFDILKTTRLNHKHFGLGYDNTQHTGLGDQRAGHDLDDEYRGDGGKQSEEI